jgi:hypothetical protein
MALQWEKIKNSGDGKSFSDTLRASVPGGWLVFFSAGITFYPDSNHTWTP